MYEDKVGTSYQTEVFFVATSAILKRGIKEAQTEDAYYKMVEWNYRVASGRLA